MKLVFALILATFTVASYAQVWKTLPQGVRIIGYRNVTTNKISKNFDNQGHESSLGASFRIDGNTLNQLTNNIIGNSVNANALNSLVVGEYNVDANAQFNVQGTGFGWGLTDKVMFYAEIAYYKAEVRANIKRTAGNTYGQTAELLRDMGEYVLAENVQNFVDVKAETIQSVITNYYNYKPIGNWYGAGYGDMETGLMTKVIDRGYTGLMFYSGLVLPTGRKDDPDILQDVGFGNGNFGAFGELASGYLLNDKFSFGTSLRYTYNASTQRELRVPESRDFQLSAIKDTFDVKYGDKINYMLNTTISLTDWISFTPIYRFMYQLPTNYDSENTNANQYLGYNTSRSEHQAQLTTSISSITPFLKKEFILPAQINLNLVKTISGNNVPAQERLEVEFRMLF